MATFAPSEARRLAIAAPMPRDPPVINAIFPSSFLVIVFLHCCDLCDLLSQCSVSFGIKLTLDKRVSNDLFTYRYEIRNCSSTARTTPRLRPGCSARTRHAHFLGERL